MSTDTRTGDALKEEANKLFAGKWTRVSVVQFAF
jgi:hypothetical protein